MALQQQSNCSPWQFLLTFLGEWKSDNNSIEVEMGNEKIKSTLLIELVAVNDKNGKNDKIGKWTIK